MNKILKKHGKKLLINSVIEALIVVAIVYIIIGPYNTEFVNIMQVIEKGGSAIEISFFMFPIILIIYLIINLGRIVMKEK